METEVDKLLELFLSQVVLDRARVKQLTVVIANEAVLAERVVDELEDWKGIREAGTDGGQIKEKPVVPSSPSCSFCLTKSEPPTTPTTTFLRRFFNI